MVLVSLWWVIGEEGRSPSRMEDWVRRTRWPLVLTVRPALLMMLEMRVRPLLGKVAVMAPVETVMESSESWMLMPFGGS